MMFWNFSSVWVVTIREKMTVWFTTMLPGLVGKATILSQMSLFPRDYPSSWGAEAGWCNLPTDQQPHTHVRLLIRMPL